jgi:hypothetical protein
VPQQAVLDARREIHQCRWPRAVEKYVVDLIFATRYPERYSKDLRKWIQIGASPRGGLALDKCSRAYAWLQGRDHVTPDDVRAVVHDCLRHRVSLSYEASASGIDAQKVVSEIVKLVRWLDGPKAAVWLLLATRRGVQSRRATEARARRRRSRSRRDAGPPRPRSRPPRGAVEAHRLRLRDRDRRGDSRRQARRALPEPAAIHVSRAQWLKSGARLQLMVEMQDRGYPGSNYELDYDAVHDTLFGTYHHLGLNQDFQVSFYRLKPGDAGAAR